MSAGSAGRDAGWQAIVAGTFCAILALAALAFIRIDLAVRGASCQGTCRPATFLATGLLLLGAVLVVHGLTVRLRR